MVLPYFCKGEIVKGFGRGSRELGFPTANMEDKVTDKLPDDFECGVYFGWAKVDEKPVHEMVMSVGFNPYYNNTKKTMETHILHISEGDLYGRCLKLCVAGRIRAEKNFSSLDELIQEINNDIKFAKSELLKEELKNLASDKFFTDS